MGQLISALLTYQAWEKVFRIIPEFRILRLTADFPQKVSLKLLNQGDYNSLSDLLSVCQKTIEYLNLKL